MKKAAPHVAKLTAQLAYFAESIGKNPPQLLQRRSALLVSLESIRQSSAMDADKRRQIAEWRAQWLALIAEEEHLKRVTVEHCLKAVVIGREIRKQILNYDQLSLADVSEALTLVLRVAGSFAGKDFGELQVQSQRIIAEIHDDPVWKTVADVALREVNSVIASRPVPGGLPSGSLEAPLRVAPNAQ